METILVCALGLGVILGGLYYGGIAVMGSLVQGGMSLNDKFTWQQYGLLIGALVIILSGLALIITRFF